LRKLRTEQDFPMLIQRRKVTTEWIERRSETLRETGGSSVARRWTPACKGNQRGTGKKKTTVEACVLTELNKRGKTYETGSPSKASIVGPAKYTGVRDKRRKGEGGDRNGREETEATSRSH